MKNDYGASDNYFRSNESSDYHNKNVVALNDLPEARLRLYAVKLSSKLVVLGGGGPKPKGIRTWQHSAVLSREAHCVEGISALIDRRMNNGLLGISQDGLHFVGNLKLN
jgi:hypothetical protein